MFPFFFLFLVFTYLISNLFNSNCLYFFFFYMQPTDKMEMKCWKLISAGRKVDSYQQMWQSGQLNNKQQRSEVETWAIYVANFPDLLLRTYLNGWPVRATQVQGIWRRCIRGTTETVLWSRYTSLCSRIFVSEDRLSAHLLDI